MKKKKQAKTIQQRKNNISCQWIWGRHTVEAALANPNRKIKKLYISNDIGPLTIPPNIVTVKTSKEQISAILPKNAVHQGIALLSDPLPTTTIEQICSIPSKTQNSTIMILDQITDPRNVGAILRSAAVFGAAAVILPNRNATRLTGVLAKSASGALDVVPLAHANNLVRTMELLKNSGYWCIGLDSQSKTKIPSSPQAAHQAITVGAEGSGLRRLTKEKCDMVYKIPSTGRVKSLNVSTAAAVALFALSAKEQTE